MFPRFKDEPVKKFCQKARRVRHVIPEIPLDNEDKVKAYNSGYSSGVIAIKEGDPTSSKSKYWKTQRPEFLRGYRRGQERTAAEGGRFYARGKHDAYALVEHVFPAMIKKEANINFESEILNRIARQIQLHGCDGEDAASYTTGFWETCDKEIPKAYPTYQTRAQVAVESMLDMTERANQTTISTSRYSLNFILTPNLPTLDTDITMQMKKR